MYSWKFLIFGIVFGFLFPILAQNFRNHPEYLYYLICTAPVFLGIFSYNIGKAKEQFINAQNAKEKIKKIANDLKAAQQTAKIGSWEFDIITNDLTWSDEHYAIFEIESPKPSSELHHLYRNRIHKDDLLVLDELLEKSTKDGNNFQFDHRLIFDEGKRIKYVLVLGNIIKNSEGKVVKLIGTCQDITTNTNLQQKYKFVLEVLGIGAWEYNPLNNELVWDNSMYQLYNISPSDFTGDYHAWESSLTPEVKEEAIKELQMAIMGKKEYDTTFQIQTKSSAPKFIGGKAKVIRDSNGKSLKMYGINWDKTKEVKEENINYDQKTMLENILHNIPCMIFVKSYDNNFAITHFNKAAEVITGINAHDIIGKTDYDFFPKEQADFFISKDKEVFNSKDITKIEKEEITTKRGKRYLRTYKCPIYHKNGLPNLIIGFSTDITDEIELQKSLEAERVKAMHTLKLASLGELSAGVAHEINNPLSIIAGNLAVLPKYKNDPVQFDKKCEDAKKSVERIKKIILGLKKFSRTSDSAEKKEESLKEILKEVITLTEVKAKRHLVKIEYNFQTDSIIECNSIEVEQVFINLINNAIDATKLLKEKWVKIELLELKSEIVVLVSDSGEKIPTEIEHKIFQPFFTTKPVGKGTGLGLSISKGIIEQHRGQMIFKNSSSHTCFEVRLPKIKRNTNVV